MQRKLTDLFRSLIERKISLNPFMTEAVII